jgi:hypothetical protein
LSQIEWFVVPAMAVDPVKPSDGRPIALVEWEVPYEEIRPGRPIKLQVPPIQEDTVLYVLRVRVPEKLSLQQLEQLRKNWVHEVRKEISATRTHQDTFVVQKTYYGSYTGGFFLYGMGQDTVPPTTSVLAPPTYTVWTTQPIGYPVEGGFVLGEFTPTHVGLPIPVPESISADVRRGTQGEIVVTFTQLH